jgi:hypothetical protein
MMHGILNIKFVHYYLSRNVASSYVTQRLEHAQFHKCTLGKGGKYASDIDPSSIVHKVAAFTLQATMIKFRRGTCNYGSAPAFTEISRKDRRRRYTRQSKDGRV